MGDGALRIERAGVGELQTAASSILAPLSVTAPDTAAFRADIDAAALGRLAVARIRGSEHRVTRPPRVITSTDPEVLTLTLHHARPAVLDQGGHQGRAGKGDFVVIDMTRPYRLDVVDGCDVLAVASRARSWAGTPTSSGTRRCGCRATRESRRPCPRSCWAWAATSTN
ncbi:AraC-like ligand-binding domain-containing protein [Streptomyces sp. NPDC002758]